MGNVQGRLVDLSMRVVALLERLQGVRLGKVVLVLR